MSHALNELVNVDLIFTVNVVFSSDVAYETLFCFLYTVYETNAVIALSIIWQFYQIRYTDSRVSILDVHERKAT